MYFQLNNARWVIYASRKSNKEAHWTAILSATKIFCLKRSVTLATDTCANAYIWEPILSIFVWQPLLLNNCNVGGENVDSIYYSDDERINRNMSAVTNSVCVHVYKCFGKLHCHGGQLSGLCVRRLRPVPLQFLSLIFLANINLSVSPQQLFGY